MNKKWKRKVDELDNVLSEQIKDKWEHQRKLQKQLDQIKEALCDVAYSLTKEFDEIKERLKKLEDEK